MLLQLICAIFVCGVASQQPGINDAPIEMVPTGEPGMSAPADEIVQAMAQQNDDPSGHSSEPYIPETGHPSQGHPGSGIGETTRALEPVAVEPVPEVEFSAAAPGIDKVEDVGDHILDEIESSKPVDDIDKWNLDNLVDETKTAEERKKVLEQRHRELQQQKLREQALKLKKKTELDTLVIEAERKCEKWKTLNDQGEADMYDLFKEAVNSSLAARDGSKYHTPPVLVEKQLHITTLGINALKCHASYVEKLSVFVEKTCDISKHVRTMLTNYIAMPNEKLLLPSIETTDTAEFHVPTRKEINVLKLTAANAHAKVKAALKEYQLHSARLEALEIEDEKDIDTVGAEDDNGEKDDGVPPHMLPIEILFQHIVGRTMQDEPPASEKQMLASEKLRIQKEMEDCFGDDCSDPKEYNGKQ
jgi:hypothetical protein